MAGEKLIRASDARKAILKINPKSAYCIDSVPAVDAEEVVRCHECQQSYKSSGSSTGYRCKVWGVYDQDCDCDPNGFCHKGERRCNNG
jgi:hypothetical protein